MWRYHKETDSNHNEHEDKNETNSETEKDTKGLGRNKLIDVQQSIGTSKKKRKIKWILDWKEPPCDFEIQFRYKTKHGI